MDIQGILSRGNEIHLSLVNEDMEIYTAGKMTTLIHKNNKTRCRWKMDTPLSNVRPFTWAAIHGGRDIELIPIKPVLPLSEGGEIELLLD